MEAVGDPLQEFRTEKNAGHQEGQLRRGVANGQVAGNPHDKTEFPSRFAPLPESEPFKPDPKKSLADNGLGHKSLVRFKTPGLSGINGSFS